MSGQYAEQQKGDMGDSSVPIANGGASTTASGKAIEFAEYMAKDAEYLLRVINEYFQIKESEDYVSPLLGVDLDNALEVLCEAQRGLQGAIYEFRKRVDRTAPETSTRSADE